MTGWEDDPLGIMQEVYSRPYEQIVYVQSSLGFLDTNGSPNLTQTTRPSDSQQKKKEPAKLWTLLFRLTTG